MSADFFISTSNPIFPEPRPTFHWMRLLCSGERMLQPQNKGVQETQLGYQPRQPVQENQHADKKKQRTAKQFDGVEILSEALVELHELADAQRGQQEGNGKTSRIHRQQQHAARDRVACGSERQHRGQNRTDARRPSERKREAKKKSTQDARLFASAAQMHIAVEPARHRRPEEPDHGEREEMDSTEPGKKRPAVNQRNDAEDCKENPEDDSDADRQLDENPEQVEAEKKNQRAGDRSQRGAMLPEKSANRAGR